jgi:hypothetical protein
MSVCFDAFDRVVRIEAELVENLLVEGIVQRHNLLRREQSDWLLVFKLLVPGVGSNLFNSISVLRLNLKDLRNKMAAIC